MAKTFKTKTKKVEVELYQTSDGQWIPGIDFAIAHEEKLEKQKKLEIKKKIRDSVEKVIKPEEHIAEIFYNFKTKEEADIFYAPGAGKWAKIYYIDSYGDYDYEYIPLEKYISYVERYLEKIKNF